MPWRNGIWNCLDGPYSAETLFPYSLPRHERKSVRLPNRLNSTVDIKVWPVKVFGRGPLYQAVEKSPADACSGRYDLKPFRSNPEPEDERQPRLPRVDVQLHQP